VATDDAADPLFTHTFSLLNSGTGQGPSFTIVDYQGLQARKYAASTLASLSIPSAGVPDGRADVEHGGVSGEALGGVVVGADVDLGVGQREAALFLDR